MFSLRRPSWPADSEVIMSIPMPNWKRRGERLDVSAFSLKPCDRQVFACLVHTLEKLPVDECGLPLELAVSSLPFSGSAEAYRLEIRKTLVRASAPDVRGLHCALEQLRQLLFCGQLHTGLIEASPAFASRALMLDVSRGKLPSIAYLKTLVDFMSSVCLNVLQLYMEDRHRLAGSPLVGSLYGAYGEEEIRELDQYARERFVELQPNIQTFSHMHGVLRFGAYSDLAENDSLFSFSACCDGVLDFLDREFAQVLPWYSSRTVNINMDEAYDLGSGLSRDLVEKEGKGKVFLSYLVKVADLARKHGAQRIQLWGDIFLKYPDLAVSLPDDVTVIDWNYNPADSYPSILAFKDSALDHWAACGTSSWNSIFPRVYNSLVNIRGYAVDAFDSGATGYMITDWGDYGHYQPYGLSLFAYLYAAECAWNIHRSDNSDEFWLEACSLLFPDPGLSRAFRLLMDSNLAPGMQTGFKTMSIYAFFDDMLKGLSLTGNEKYPKLEAPAFRWLMEKGQQAMHCLESDSRLSSFWPQIAGDVFRREVMLAARMSEYTGRKGLLSWRIISDFNAGSLDSAGLLDHIIGIKRLYRDFTLIRNDFTSLWLERARSDGMESTLFLFDKASVQLSKAAIFLAGQREALLAGKTPCLDDYHGADDYGTLWTADFRNMWDRAYPWQ